MNNNYIKNKEIVSNALEYVHTGLIKVYKKVIDDAMWKALKAADDQRNQRKEATLIDKFQKLEDCDVQACFKLYTYDFSFQQKLKTTYMLNKRFIDFAHEGIQVRNAFSHPDIEAKKFTNVFTYEALKTCRYLLEPFKREIDEFELLDKYINTHVKAQVIMEYSIDELLSRYFPLVEKTEFIFGCIKCGIELTSGNEYVRILDFEENLLKLSNYFEKASLKKRIHLVNKYPSLLSHFIGRDDEISHIKHILSENHMIVLQGFGGMGKSCVALKYIEINKSNYTHIQHIFFEENIKNTILRLEFENYNDIKLLDEERYKNRLDILKKLDKKSLIIIDNMDIPKEHINHPLFKDLEDLSCNIIITTRVKELFPPKYMYSIKPMSIENQLLLFEFHYRRNIKETERHQINEILRLIDGHTLLIEIIAKTMDNSDMSALEMLDFLNDADHNDITDEVDIEKDNTRYQNSLDQYAERLFDISKLDEASMYILNLLSFSPLGGINRKLFKDASHLPNNNLINILISNSWITKDESSETIRIRLHPVISKVVIKKKSIHFNQIEGFLNAIHQSLKSKKLSDEDSLDWCQYLSNLSKFNLFNDLHQLEMLSILSKDVWDMNAYGLALHMYINLYRAFIENHIYEPIFEHDTLSNIASLYTRVANYDESIAYFLKAIEIGLKDDLISVAHTYNELANVYRKKSEYQRAIVEYENALKFANNDIDLADAYNGLGVVYINSYDYHNALTYYQKALEIRHQNPLETKRNLAYSYNNIGTVYQRLEVYDKALDFHKQALQLRKEIFPEKHPDIAASYNHIGIDYQGLKSREAIVYFNQALDIRIKILGENHPDVAWTYFSIAQTEWKLLNNPLIALDYIEKVNSIREKTIGKNHTYTLESLYIKGLLLIELNRFSDAKEILDYAYKMSQTNVDTPQKLLDDIKEAQLLCS